MTTLTPGLLACPPRFGTQRTSRPTIGGQVAAVARRLGKPLMPWQQYVADVLGEQNPDGSLVYGEGNLIVGRQEGKTEFELDENVHRVTAMVLSHGPQRVTFTMQSRKKARMRLERDYAARLRSGEGFSEIDAQSRKRPRKLTEWRLGMNSGVEAIQFGPSSYLQIDTPSRTDGHGDTIDRGSIDEAFAHEDNTVEVGMEPAMLTRPDAQLMVLSAAGDTKSKYLWRKILRGRKMVEAGADAGLAYFEWSAQYGEDDPSDPETWRRCCPALGFTVTEAKLEALWRKAVEGGQADIDAFCRSYLCMWPEVPVLDDDVLAWLAIPKTFWTDNEQPDHTPSGPLRYALDVDENARGEQWASIGCSDGVHIELVTPHDATPGTGWVVSACAAKKQTIGELLVAGDGPAAALIDDLEKAGVNVRRMKPAEFVAASMQFHEAAIQGALRHIGQPVLNTAVAGLRRRDVGDGQFRWSRTLSPVDIGPAIAVTMARWAAGQEDGPSVYEERGLVTLG